MAFTKVVGPGIHTQSQLRTHNIHSSGIITASSFVGPLTASSGSSGTFDSLTITGNVSIGGTLQYEDVTNVESVGIITAKEGIFLPDSKELKLGNSAASPDLKISHDPSTTPDTNRITAGSSQILELQTDKLRIVDVGATKDLIAANDGGSVDLFYAGNKKLETTSTGAVVSGILTATTFSGTLSGGLPITSGADNRVITASSASAIQGEANLTFDGSTLGVTGDVTMTNTSSNPQLALISANNGLSEIQFGDGADAVRGNIIYRAGSAGDALCFNGYNNTERMRIDSSGYLKLSGRNIQGSANGDKLLRIYQPSRTDAEEDVLLLQSHNTSTENWITIGGGDSSFNAATDIAFRTATVNTTSGTDRLLITSAGKVGINTTTPNSALEVQGDGGVNDATITFTRHGTPGNDGIIGSNFYRIGTDSVAGIGAYRESAMDDAYLAFHTQPTGGNYTERLRIKSDGNIVATGNIKSNNLPGRNLIINGSFQIAQRATTNNTAGSQSTYHTLDRWLTQIQAGTITESQQSLSSSDTGPWGKGLRKYMRLLNQSGIGGGAAQYAEMDQLVEAQTVAQSGWYYNDSASYITLSFWIRASVAQAYTVVMYTDDGTNRHYPFTVTLSANTWTKVEKAIPGNSGITINNDNGRGVRLTFIAAYGTNYTSNSGTLNSWNTTGNGLNRFPDVPTTWATTTNATFDLTGVQLEVGSIATEFEHKSYAEDLQLCMRYYYKLHNADGDQIRFVGYGGGGTTAGFSLIHKPPMRDTPTGTVTVSSGTFSYNDGLAAYSGTGGWSFNGNRFGCDVNTSTDAGSGVLTGHALSIYSGGSGTSIELSAEL